MADAINTLNEYNTGSFLIPELWAKDIIYANQPNFLFMPFSSKSLEATASTVRWAVMGTLNVGGTLHSGTTISAGTLAISQITKSPQEYGNAVTWSGASDILSFTDMRNNVGYIAIKNDYAQTMDKVAYNELKTGTWFCLGGTFGTANAQGVAFSGTLSSAETKVNVDTIKEAVKQLKLRKAPTFDNGRYTAVLHVNTVDNLYNDGTFREVQRYRVSEAPLINGVTPSGWRCAYAGADIYETTEITTKSVTFGTSGTVTLYEGVMFGKDAFGDGWAKPLEIRYYDDANLDGGRQKKLMWYSLGLVKLLKPENVQIIRTSN